MNKEEILERSRKEHKDEGFQSAEDKGRELGMIAFCLVFIFITIFNLIHGRENEAPLAMFWAFLAAEAYPKYRFTKRKSYLVSTIAGAIASILNLIQYVITVLK